MLKCTHLLIHGTNFLLTFNLELGRLVLCNKLLFFALCLLKDRYCFPHTKIE